MPNSLIDPQYNISPGSCIISFIRTKTQACIVIEELGLSDQPSIHYYKLDQTSTDNLQVSYTL